MLSTDKQTDKQTDKLTNATKNITFFAKEVMKTKTSQHLLIYINVSVNAWGY